MSTPELPKCDVCARPTIKGEHGFNLKDIMVFGAPAKMHLFLELYYQVGPGIETHIPHLCNACAEVAIKTGLSQLKG